jgi:hypothetical protein
MVVYANVSNDADAFRERENKMTKFEIDGLDFVVGSVARTQYKQDPLTKARNKIIKQFDKYSKTDQLELTINGVPCLGVPYGNTFLKHPNSNKPIGANISHANESNDVYNNTIAKLRQLLVNKKLDAYIQPMLDAYKARYAKRTTKLANKKQLKLAA